MADATVAAIDATASAAEPDQN